mmetsp:Transcript_33157/g.75700  ORF Transcript_33157/g.75700 Transcript_33157/m.75700 type:complete len:94 (-) Transcript_33157:1679-1960(-)
MFLSYPSHGTQGLFVTGRFYTCTTECLSRYQLLFANPRTFHSPSLDSGWLLNAMSTPLQLSTTLLPSSHTVAGTLSHSQKTQAHALPYGCDAP